MATRSPLLRIHDMLESIRGIEKKLSPAKLSATTSAPGSYDRRWSEVLR
jgi:hypothetical protein